MVLRRSEWLARLGTSLVEVVEILEPGSESAAIASQSVCTEAPFGSTFPTMRVQIPMLGCHRNFKIQRP